MKYLILTLSFMIMISSTWAEDSLFIDITIRDFSSNHPDFENFNSKVSPAGPTDCGYVNQDQLLPDPSGDSPFKQSFFDQLRRDFPTRYSWATPAFRDIYPTFGMVEASLGEDGKPIRARIACNNENFDQWFRDIEDVNFTVNDVIALTPIDPTSNVYQVKYSFWDTPRNSFFPLDKHAAASAGNNVSPINGEVRTWGKQNADGWCNGNIATCQGIADNNGNVYNSLATTEGAHNYGYTVQGQLQFAYRATGDEVFTFQGDDDMWIFIDGQLVVDLGGTHLPVSSSIDLDSIASVYGWLPNTPHTMDFFYAERQTDAANLTLTVTLNDIVPSKNRSPYITRMEKVEGTAQYNMFLNVELDDNTLNQIAAGSYTQFFSVLNEAGEDISGFYNISSIKPLNIEDDERKYGVKYEIEFFVSDVLLPSTGPDVGNDISLNMASDLDIVGSNGLRVDKYAHTEIVGIQASLTGNQTISPLEGVFEKVPIDPAIIEEAFGTDGLSDEDGVVLRYGSLNLENEEATSPIYYSQITYDQIIKSLESTQFTKGQTFGESPDVCSDGSCIDTLRFAILGPTIINLQFFDHFGQYINRYSQVVTQSQLDSAYREQGLMEVVGGVEYPRQPYVAISPNIIPVDQYGRSWGSHPIIVQLDMIELPPETCFVKDAAKNLNCDLKVTGQPNRTIKSFLIGYRRINDGAGVALTP